jgi:hypothetical protein
MTACAKGHAKQMVVNRSDLVARSDQEFFLSIYLMFYVYIQRFDVMENLNKF